MAKTDTQDVDMAEAGDAPLIDLNEADVAPGSDDVRNDIDPERLAHSHLQSL